MRGRGARLILVAVTAWAATGCSAIPAARPDSSGCVAFQSTGVCEKRVDAAIDRHPGAQAIDLTCTAPVCDRASGFGTVSVTQRDGSLVSDTFSYAYDAAPMPDPTCVGLPVDACRSEAELVFDGVDPERRVEAVTVTCASQPCTGADALLDVRIRYADGTTEQHSVGMTSGEP